MNIQHVLKQLSEHGGYRKLREVDKLKDFLGAIVDLEVKKDKVQIPRELKEFLLSSRHIELVRDGINTFMDEFVDTDMYGEILEFIGDDGEEAYLALKKAWQFGFGKIEELVIAQEQEQEKIVWTEDMDKYLTVARRYLTILREGDTAGELFDDINEEENIVEQYIEEIRPVSDDKFGLY